mmetsp:Transcript_4128/g.8446  ORF Transcript_4128/g.8446 Transcript_4128/m.8446 type:complete len:214 (+) Transcript_4128:500-1141(+)
MEAVSESGATIGIISKEGIVIATEKKETKRLIDEKTNLEKFFIIDDHIVCTGSGVIPDFQILIDHARIQAQQYKKTFQDFIPVKKIVEIICDIKQQFTQRGRQRPFGLSLLIAGWDSFNGFQLFRTDSAGTFSGWKSVAIGSNSLIYQSILSDEYQNDNELSFSLSIIVKIFNKKVNNSELWKLIDLVLLVLDDKEKLLIKKLDREEINSLIF